MVRFGALVAFTALIIAAPGFAWSSPSPATRRAIVAAIREKPASSGVARVERVRISTVDRRFASAVTFPRDKAGNVLARDRWLVRHYPSGWRVVFVGSDMPPCNVAVAAVRRDLLGSAACFGDTSSIRIGVETETIGPWHVHANPTLAGAIAAFGTPSRCSKVTGLPSFASVDWRRLGLRAVFGTYGSGGARPCQATRAVRLDNARASSKEWQTGRGLRVGDSVAKLRRLYPQAFLRTYPRGIPPARGWWLVVRTGRVPELYRFPALLATVRGGRVTALVVTVEAEGD